MATSYIGRFGEDAAGEFGLRSLREEGVDLTYAETVARTRTQIAFIVIDARSGERTVIWQRDEKLAYEADEVPLDAINAAAILHFTPHDTGACLAMARKAKDAGVLVSVDIDNLFEGVHELLSYVDIFIASAEFPSKLLRISDNRKALREISSMFGCGVVGVTLGESGSLLLCGDEFIETPGYTVPGGCQDTTGAGDAFRVGLLFGLLNGETIEESAKMANAVAALKCRAVGARTALPTRAELQNLIGDEATA